jgi:predicted glycosyltransferase
VRPEDIESFYVKEKKSIVYNLIRLFNKENINVVYLPREREDINYVKGLNVQIPRNTLNGLDLVYFADAVLTGSGTMAREAACIGKTAVSFFPSIELLSVDKQLVNEGKLFHSRNPKEIVDYILLNLRKNKSYSLTRSKNVKKEVVHLINTCFNEK